MGIIKDNKKFTREKTQKNPTNPDGGTAIKNKEFDLDVETIKEKKSKK